MSMENQTLGGELVTSWDDVPEQRTGSIPTLPRGEYRFRLPYNLAPDKWVEGKDKEGAKFYRVSFDANLPLVVTATNVTGVEPDAMFRGSISTRPIPRFVGKKGDPPKYVSDAVYLYLDALSGSKTKFKITDHLALVQEICALGAGKEIQARVVWPAYCNKKKVRYIQTEEGTIEDPSGLAGCGANYRDGQTIDPHTGLISERFTCKGKDGIPCGAAIRVFPELANFALVVPF